MDISNHFCVRPVGQGLFYTGCLPTMCSQRRFFNFVYDCGSTRKKGIEPVIDSYIKNELKCDILDMIVISHFDADHVNGLPYLLGGNQGVRVERVYIPYYDVEDYLLAVIWIEVFHLEHRINSVIFVTMQDNEDLKQLQRSDLGKGKYKPREDKYSIESRVMFHLISHDTEVTLEEYCWRFKFYNRTIEIDRKLTIKEKIDRLLSKYQCKALSDLLAKKEVRQELKNIYIENTKVSRKETPADSINNSSLCMYHGPLMKIRINIDALCSFYPHKQEKSWMDRNSFCWHIELPAGTLLTGDISLAGDSCMKDFVAHYQEELNLVGVFSVPHHGSQFSWNEQIINWFSEAIFICSYGLTNGYYHPSFQVIAALGEAQKQVFFSTERHMIEYDFFIKFKKSHGL